MHATFETFIRLFRSEMKPIFILGPFDNSNKWNLGWRLFLHIAIEKPTWILVRASSEEPIIFIPLILGAESHS